MAKVLVMLGGGWHPFASRGDILKKYLADTAGCDVDTTDDREAFARLDGYDAVVIYTQGGELTPAQEKGLLSYVKAGGGLVRHPLRQRLVHEERRLHGGDRLAVRSYTGVPSPAHEELLRP